jgi:hypothetical protein
MKASALLFSVTIIFTSSLSAQKTDFASTNFNKADSLADLYSNSSLRDLKALSDKLTQPLDKEEEKFRAIYKWICNNIDYDHTLYVKLKKKKEKHKIKEAYDTWNKESSKQVFKALLESHQTICSGYAYLVKELAAHAGISCVVVDGYGRTTQTNINNLGNANHSWNAVQLNNKWYLCDATWSCGIYDQATAQYVRRYDDSYFLADPALFIHKHYPLDERWLLLPDKPSLKGFLNGPIIYSDAIKYHITKLLPATFDLTTAKGKNVSFKFVTSNPAEIEKAELRIHQSKEFNSMSVKLYQDSAGRQCIDHAFRTKGIHIVHILLNDGYAFTYRVTVI